MAATVGVFSFIIMDMIVIDVEVIKKERGATKAIVWVECTCQWLRHSPKCLRRYFGISDSVLFLRRS